MKIKFLNLEGFQKSSIFIISIGIFIIINLLISVLPLKLDLSKGRAYSLSDSTKKIIGNLDDRLNIKIFISSDLPLRLLQLKINLIDFVKEYQRASNGKITLKILDPKKDSAAASEARSLGIPELSFSQIEKDKYAVSSTYFGIAVLYGDKKEIIPQATNLASLEYDLTSSIYKMTLKEPVKIGIFGRDEFEQPISDELLSFKKILSQQFDLDFIKPSTDSKAVKIDPNLKTLLVIDDYKKEYTDSEKKALADYIRGGGKAIFMIDGLYISPDSLTVVEAKHNLFNFFQSFGLRLNRNFVLSTSSELANFTAGEVSFFSPYPLFVKTTNFSESDPNFSNVQSLSFPWVSSLTLSKKQGVESAVLVKSEKNSWTQSQNFILEPDKIPEPSSGQVSEQNLIVEAKVKGGGAITVIPSSRFVKEQFLQGSLENAGFLLNLVNMYASGGALSGIRSRAMSVAPIKEYPETVKDAVKYLNVILLPLLFGFFGSIRLLRRK